MRRSRSNAQRSDAVGVPEAKDAEASHHRGASKGSLACAIHIGERSEEIFRVGTSLTELLKPMGKDIQTAESARLIRYKGLSRAPTGVRSQSRS